MGQVFIGMPVYNMEKYVSQALDSFISQSMNRWTLYISDNASSDNTGDICRKYAEKDQRIHYFRQTENIGALKNFEFVLSKADAPQFMWAAGDDVWHRDFLKSCSNQLVEYDSGLAFCNIVNIDGFRHVIRRYPDFSKFVTGCIFTNVTSFLMDPEIYGKANLIYGLYQTDFCGQIWKTASLDDYYASDVAFVLAAIARKNISIDQRVLFGKRIVRETDAPDRIYPIMINEPLNHTFPLNEAISYIAGLLRAVRSTQYYDITSDLMMRRLAMVLKQNIRPDDLKQI